MSQIGSKVKIDLESIKDRIPSSLIAKLKENPRAIVKDYKMTDGGGVGVIVKLNDGSKRWFFEDEFGRG